MNENEKYEPSELSEDDLEYLREYVYNEMAKKFQIPSFIIKGEDAIFDEAALKRKAAKVLYSDDFTVKEIAFVLKVSIDQVFQWLK